MRQRATPVTAGLCGGLLILLGVAPSAQGHTRWADGTPVPAWVRDACCVPADTHHLDPAQVHRSPDGFRVDGVHGVIPPAKVLPSVDGDYWVFYRDYPDGTQFVFCLFAPPEGA